jgi:DNA helicase INO80
LTEQAVAEVPCVASVSAATGTQQGVLSSLFSEPDGGFIEHPRKGEILTHCDKMQRLDILLAKLKTDGHRVLIYSQMTRMLDLLEE